MKTRILVVQCIILLLAGCEDNNLKNEDAMTEKAELNYSVAPTSIYIEVASTANYLADLNKSITKGDLRFVGIMGYAMVVPGVPNWYEKYRESHGVKIIEGTTDNYTLEDTAAFINADFYKEYAKSYNVALLKHLGID